MEKSKKKIIILELVALIILTIVGVIFIAMNGNETKETAKIENVSEEVKTDTEEKVINENKKEQMVISENELKEKKEDEAVKEEVVSNNQVVEEKPANPTVSENEIAPETVEFEDYFPETNKEIKGQLKELQSYWQEERLDAVDDLIRLPRYRYVSQLIKGDKLYFYYGSVDENDEPHGKGIAVYAGNQYYYGDWKNGIREGTGRWIQIFVKGGQLSRDEQGIISHSYAGTWLNDKPQGQGQEQMLYDERFLEKRQIQNVIGTFQNALYHGEMYVTTIDENKKTEDFKGTAQAGLWTPLQEANAEGNYPICVDVKNPNNYIWIKVDENTNQGVSLF